MGKKKKTHKKDHKKKKHKSKRDRAPSESSTSSSSSSSAISSRSASPDRDKSVKHKQKGDEKSGMAFFDKVSDASWHLSQKSETLMYDQWKESEEKHSETFIWKKKNQKTGLDKLEPEKMMMLNKLKQEETARELEKLKRRKIEREREREELEREREFLQRQKEGEYHREWEKQEDSFQLKQVKLRSKIRIEEGRAKPIDLLAKYINAEDDDLAIEMHEPYTYLNGLTILDLENLLADIKVYSELEKGVNSDYWRDISIVTEDELKKLQKLDKFSREHVGDRHEGINQSVLQEVTSTFRSKTSDELKKLEESIKFKIENETGIDVGYWESLLSQLKAHMARARLRDRHNKILNEKLKKLKKEQGIKERNVDTFEKRLNERIQKEEKNYFDKKREIESEEKDEFERIDKIDELNEANEVDLMMLSIKEYEHGNYSPILLRDSDLADGVFILTQEEDNKRIELKRNKILRGETKTEQEEFEAKLKQNLTDSFDDTSANNGEPKAAEVAIEHHYMWADKYRPRKPRYYNRVHTGYEWNQYNKKHYDVDNPPPKTVQGYKFNIFYPDLIDKTVTPRYSITACKDNKDFAILRFHAGAPYEDVAFKIVKKEWDISHRHGFRNQFQNGIYQLWFHFRKWKYRR